MFYKMKKITVIVFAMALGFLAIQLNAQPSKAPMRSSIYSSLPTGFQQAGESSIYYSIAQRNAAGPGAQYGISILGKIGDRYYSSTYGSSLYTDNPGAGFITALQVNGGTPSYLTSAGTTTVSGESITPSVEGQGEVAARVIYTLTNNNTSAVTVNVGAWADIYIGNNDYAPISCLRDADGNVYALDLKESTDEDSPLLCVLFGENITGVSAVDDYWFGYYRTNYYANNIVGNYSSETLDNWGDYSHYYMIENGSYDSGMGMCWKNRTIEAGETIELSFLISVGNIDFDDPVIPDPEPDPGQDIFTYNVAAINFAGWNDLSVAHPAHAWGHYEHPYGQSGYLEYQVDDENTWHEMGELVSGEDSDLDFNMLFNENRLTDHVLRVRFTLGLGNYTDLEGLNWIDVRANDIIGFEDRTYNGQAQTFDVTIGDESFVAGTNGEYTNPGEYTYSVNGVFDENTIGINAVEFTIDKAQTQIEVVIPERTQYDGLAHGATVTVIAGDGQVNVSYVNVATGVASTDAPTAVGNYLVVVNVNETEFYYGYQNSYGPFEIYATETAVEELTIDSEDKGAWYTIDGQRIAAPTQRGLYIHNGKKYIIK